MKKLHLISIACIALFIALTANAAGETPTDVIKKANGRIADIQKNNSERSAIAPLVEKVLESVTGFSTIADRVSGAICSSDDAKCKEFNSAFENFLKASYAQKLSKYKSDKTDYLGESKKGSKTLVRTKVSSGNKSVKLDYELEKINKKWVITNYIFDDINTVENYKKQFKRMLKKDSMDKVIRNLKTKTENIKSGKAE
jgi:phospholipid transport system substrate-binding protein